MEGEIKKRNRR
uniref:Uncharacterized protein n=1 Tax=Anguilla anguilla TaxID=7936 RepID=A0A0E9URU6_ANGAN